ncbi:hypothetical protein YASMINEVIRUS_179 [Yasminevirus sp. GU-2018]|uniref:Uncharacterized protein n=1 Tax=Yasminevirus sp. GU-2018 TaxID=2420051 RepID=A0A5K0U9B2_9VIRU|nr:hypothetical protein YASMINEVIRUS_179 [Yasminevirus sp. GU-2018]
MVKLHIVAIILILLGAVNTTTCLFDVNLVQGLGNYTHDSVSSALYVLIGLSVLYIMFDRSTYLPFLGESVFPCHILAPRTPVGADQQVKIKTRPNTKIVYWAAEPDKNSDRGYQEAYKSYQNSGVVVSDRKGVAVLQVKKPSGYKVPFSKLGAHIHYRECVNKNMLNEVKTVFV